MNDIEILESFINQLEEFEEEELKQALENLINRVKELEEIEEEHRKENGRLSEENKKLKYILFETRNKLKFKVITKDNDYWGPRKNLTKQEVYKTVREIIDLLKANYCLLDDEIAIQEILEEK